LASATGIGVLGFTSSASSVSFPLEERSTRPCAVF
jgi:hypothetical protein